MSTGYKRLGEILVDRGYVAEEDLAKALSLQESTSTRLGEIVSSMGWANENQVTQCLAEQYGYDVVDVNEIDFDTKTLALVSSDRALRNLVLPIGIKDGFLHCIIGDPINVVPIDELRIAQELPLKICMAPPSELREAIIQQYYRVSTTAVGKLSTARAKEESATPVKNTLKRKLKIDSQTDRVALLNALEFELCKNQDRRMRAR